MVLQFSNFFEPPLVQLYSKMFSRHTLVTGMHYAVDENIQRYFRVLIFIATEFIHWVGFYVRFRPVRYAIDYGTLSCWRCGSCLVSEPFFVCLLSELACLLQLECNLNHREDCWFSSVPALLQVCLRGELCLFI